jgi:hypothetical protein
MGSAGAPACKKTSKPALQSVGSHALVILKASKARNILKMSPAFLAENAKADLEGVEAMAEKIRAAMK